MPTILLVHGWRFFFYSNESNEPAHIHCRKAERECKFWLNPDVFSIEEAYSYGLSPQDTRTVRRIVFANFDYIVEEWNKIHGA